MLPNEFVEITCVLPNRRFSWREFAGFNQCRKTANEVLSALARCSFEQYREHPFITTQIIEDGTIDCYSHFISFPKRSGTRYIVRYMIINDLPF